ncbi:asparagine synthase B [Butyrivibrio sp. INlla21]|uniref:asparagine synthase B n=1 Tax=Butyrivibrio sp. INlla21 TaxID=1520811 RepID=UPI0008F3BA3B|nr:asparagine synthase B [Butyrivibrio sp. INlla21]SFU76186.1 asparagine synthase (glutamine-hydrolysing) [Butyrivibrio sp. INlla21]
MCAILTYEGDDISEQEFQTLLQRTSLRGPDMSRYKKVEKGYIGFNRLSIMGLNEEGMQPFYLNNNAVICNGELYGFRALREYLVSLGYSFRSDSDCEILLPLYEKLGTKMFDILDAEFACVIYDGEKKKFIAARDPIGIRPLYYGYDKKGNIIFASEPKNMVGVADKIMPFPPGHYYEDGKFICYRDMTKVKEVKFDEVNVIAEKIHDKLLKGIEKRLSADAPIGFLLSGGLDSSLVCGAAAKMLGKKIRTFAIGMDIDAIDLKYAREVADYIGSEHTEVIISKKDVIEAVEPVIEALGTYDITTIRASIGMYLLCKWIHENTDIKVILTGEISDELFGYKYTDFAPSADEFQKEAQKRIHEIHMYDVLRADRCISVNSLEARVPFGDLDFVEYVMSIDPEKKMNTYGIGKYLLRHAFEKDELIPRTILMREKAAFSDAVGHSLRDDLIECADSLYTYADYETKKKKYTHATPFTKESLWYREIFEKYYPGQSDMVVDFWMPNKNWEGCNVNDPSARVLSNYGASAK